METRAPCPADRPIAVLVKVGFSGYLFITSGTRIGCLLCPLLGCPVASSLSLSLGNEFI